MHRNVHCFPRRALRLQKPLGVFAAQTNNLPLENDCCGRSLKSVADPAAKSFQSICYDGYVLSELDQDLGNVGSIPLSAMETHWGWCGAGKIMNYLHTLSNDNKVAT